MNTSEPQPAGYFSTFSILDPNRPNPEGFGKPQKRNRRVYVCIPCHRRKLKCDKGQPCSRCIQADAADECVYQKFPFGKKDSSTEPGETSRPQSSVGNPTPCVSPAPSENEVKPPRLYGATHWSTIASEFQEAWPYISGSDPQWETRYRHIQSLKYLVASLPSPNFPFGGICECTQNRVQALNSLPARQVVDALVRSYFETFDPIYRMFHPQQFNQELEMLWIDSNQCSDEWLAQFFMMMALGCQSAPIQILNGTGHRPEDWCDRFLSNAQFFFGRSPSSSSSSSSSTTTITTIRTLCLVVIAQILEIIKGTETFPRLQTLMGYITQLSLSIHLHRTTILFSDLSPLEAELRRRLWVTVQLLDLDVAIRTGTQPINPDSDIEPPLNINNTDIYLTEHGWIIEPAHVTTSEAHHPAVVKDSTFQLKLSSLLPLLLKITKSQNSPTAPPPRPETIQSWTDILTRRISSFESALSAHSPQLDSLRVLVYRALLALPQQNQNQTKTYCFGLLDVQSRFRMLSQPTPQNFLLHGGNGPPTTNCLLSLWRDAFGAAVLHLCSSFSSTTTANPSASYFSSSTSSSASASSSYPYSSSTSSSIQSYSAASSPPLSSSSSPPSSSVSQMNSHQHHQHHQHQQTRQLGNKVLQKLRESLQDFREWACRSPTHFDEYVTLSIAVGCLEGLAAGDKKVGVRQQQQQQQEVVGIEARLNGVAAGIEHTVLAGRLWSGSAAAGAAAGAVTGAGAVAGPAAGGGGAGGGRGHGAGPGPGVASVDGLWDGGFLLGAGGGGGGGGGGFGFDGGLGVGRL